MSIPFASEISYNLKAPIWELKAWNQYLLITTKDQTTLETRFSLLDKKQKAFVFESIGFEEEWWIAAFLFNGRHIVFQTYNDTQDIENRSTFCLEVATQEVIWAIDAVKVQQVTPHTIRCTDNQSGEESFLIDVSNGQEIESPINSHEKMSMEFPQIFHPESEYYEMLKKFLSKRDVNGIVGPIEYLEHNDLIMLGLNLNSHDAYSLALYIYDDTGDLLKMTILDHELKGQVSGTFFILEQELIFVEEKHMIKICSFN